MPATFNHTIIASLDGSTSAQFYTELLEAEPAPSWGPFTNISLDDGVMLQLKSELRLGQACPAGLSMAKSADLAKAGATQHRPWQREQSARKSRRWSIGPAGSVISASNGSDEPRSA